MIGRKTVVDLVKVEDFTLVIPGERARYYVGAFMDYGRLANESFLGQVERGERTLKRAGAITGSFICSHAPDYRGRPTMGFGTREWRELLVELKEIGIDTVIYQAAAWAEFKECYYRSKAFSSYKTWDSIPRLVEACAAEGVDLYLGGFGSLLAFDEAATTETLGADRELQLACLRELAAFKEGLAGFYMSPETAFPGYRDPRREKLLNTYFREVVDGAKDILAGLPVLMSPGSFYVPGMDAEIRDCLLAFFGGVAVDYMTPQDSVGTNSNRLPHYEAAFSIWKEVCASIGSRLWVNVESFRRTAINTEQDFAPAQPERLDAQISMAAKYGEKIVSWELPYFMAAQGPGKELRDWYEARQASLPGGARKS
jgi:hypothetical protein